MTARFGLLVMMATSAACLEGDATANADNAGTTGASTDTAPSTTAPADTDMPGSGGASTGESDTGDGADESSGTGTGTGLDPEVDNPCDGFSCGAGTCALDRAGRAYCECPEPTVAAGLQCLTCTAVTEMYDIDVTASDVTLELTMAGQPAPSSATETAALWLRNPASGEMIALGETHNGSLGARVVPTGYEIVYGRLVGAEIPANRRAVVGVVDAKGTSQVAVELDLQVARIEGEFQFDGMPAPAGGTENGRVWLRNRSTGDEVYLGETRTQTFGIYVLPGVYDVEFESLTAGAVAPRNHRARVGTLEIPAEQLEVAIDVTIDIPTVEITGEFFVDGNPTPGSPNERGKVLLRDAATGDEFLIGNTDDVTYTVRVVPGDYEVVYQWIAGSAVMPANSHAIIGTLDTLAPETHDIHIDTVTVAGAFTIDAAPPPTNANDDGRLSLRNEATGDEVLLGNTTVGAYQRIVVTGLYTVHYAQDTSSGIAPANANALIESIDVADGTAFDIDVPTAFASGLITIGAGAPPDSDYDDGWVYLRNTTTGDTVLLANTRMGLFGVPVVPGTYEVVYAVETPGGQVPINVDSVVLTTIEVDGATEFDIDIPVRGMEGAIAATGQMGERGSVYLQAEGGASRSLLGNTADSGYVQPVIPGRYLVSYGVDSAAGGLPVNTNAPLACIDLMD